MFSTSSLQEKKKEKKKKKKPHTHTTYKILFQNIVKWQI